VIPRSEPAGWLFCMKEKPTIILRRVTDYSSNTEPGLSEDQFAQLATNVHQAGDSRIRVVSLRAPAEVVHNSMQPAAVHNESHRVMVRHRDTVRCGFAAIGI